VRLQARLPAALASTAAAGLPERVALFGIPSLSPGYLQVLARLAERLDVHLYLCNPCRHYWGDILPQRAIARRARHHPREAPYLESGNQLLASLGRQGRDFLDLLQELPGAVLESFAAPAENSLLGCLQADILELRNRGSADMAATPLPAGDRSVQIHVCHGPQREIEVLHDQLLALFEAHPTLQPADVVVMTPDLDRYAPYIEAIWRAEGQPHLPFSIADRSLPSETSLVAGFLSLLAIPDSRFEAGRVLELLETAAIRRRFGFAEQDLALVQRWVRDTGIRWGIDAASRGRWDLPLTTEHTWQAGLERLGLGYTLPGRNQRLFAEVLPYDEVEGQEAQTMGNLQRFAAAVFGLEQDLGGERSVADWCRVLEALLERFLDPLEEEVAAAQGLRSELAGLADMARRAGYGRPVPLEVVRARLQRQLTQRTVTGGFLRGGITVCRMVPMRSIPFAVVCLVGMNDGAFPRRQRSLSFDRMAGEVRRGDRSRRDEDRYLFLEALLSARQYFYVSYVGSSIHDNTALPPSVLVSELLDYIGTGFLPADEASCPNVLAQVMTRHPLQAFSSAYFTGASGLFSYSEPCCAASQATLQANQASTPLVDAPLPPPSETWKTLTPEGLVRFLVHPARFLLQERLGVRLEERGGLLEAREPFLLDRRDRERLGRELLALRQSRKTPGEALTLLRARGMLPHGQVGESYFRRQWDLVDRFAQVLEACLPPLSQEPLAVDLTLGGMRLAGQIEGVSAAGGSHYRLRSLTASDWLQLWVHHLLLNFCKPPAVAGRSRWLSLDRALCLQPVLAPGEALGRLLDLYGQGLQRVPPLFPKSSLAYAQALKAGRADPLETARTVWRGSEHHWGEAQDPYYQLVFRGHEPLDEEFKTLAEAVFIPILEHLEDPCEGLPVPPW
jgi:exodeoxyribonuclease V gamma subunit